MSEARTTDKTPTVERCPACSSGNITYWLSPWYGFSLNPAERPPKYDRACKDCGKAWEA